MILVVVFRTYTDPNNSRILLLFLRLLLLGRQTILCLLNCCGRVMIIRSWLNDFRFIVRGGRFQSHCHLLGAHHCLVCGGFSGSLGLHHDLHGACRGGWNGCLCHRKLNHELILTNVFVVIMQTVPHLIKRRFLLKVCASARRRRQLARLSHLLLQQCITLREHGLLQFDSDYLAQLFGVHANVMGLPIVNFGVVAD